MKDPFNTNSSGEKKPIKVMIPVKPKVIKEVWKRFAGWFNSKKRGGV